MIKFPPVIPSLEPKSDKGFDGIYTLYLRLFAEKQARVSE